MSCEELKDLYELYALGSLEGAERQEVEEHLARQCPNCVAGVRQARQWTSTLGYAAAPVEPPGRLRQRVLASVGGSEKATGWSGLTHAWATAALFLLITVLWYGYEWRALRAEIESLRARQADLVARNRIFAEALALVNLPETLQLTFGGAEPAPPRGRVWVHPQRGVLLLASRLPQAPAGRIYEMWIVPKSGAPVPAGLFNSDAQGEAMHVWPQAVELTQAGAVAVTLEPEGGVPAPTSTPLIVAAF
jgi:anti-sigma-K factor RskA